MGDVNTLQIGAARKELFDKLLPSAQVAWDREVSAAPFEREHKFAQGLEALNQSRFLSNDQLFRMCDASVV